MDKLELQERLIKGENLHTEFKESLPDNETIAKAFVCFANADGGQLIISISKSGDIVGVGDEPLESPTTTL
jgi:predicted HTH transcriptional regulator